MEEFMIEKRISAEKGAYNKIPQKILFRPDETAEIFDVSIRTIYRWVEEGKLEAIRPNKGVMRIFRDSVINLLRESIR